MTLMDRFMDKVEKIPFHECWEWVGAQANGYGNFMSRGSSKTAHRVSWSMFRGPIPTGMCVLHRCDNPLCVNPEHLFIGTQRDNMIDMYNKNRQAKHRHNGPKGMTEISVRALINDRRNGISQRAAARKYGVSQTFVWALEHGRVWSRLTGGG